MRIDADLLKAPLCTWYMGAKLECEVNPAHRRLLHVAIRCRNSLYRMVVSKSTRSLCHARRTPASVEHLLAESPPVGGFVRQPVYWVVAISRIAYVAALISCSAPVRVVEGCWLCVPTSPFSVLVHGGKVSTGACQLSLLVARRKPQWPLARTGVSGRVLVGE